VDKQACPHHAPPPSTIKKSSRKTSYHFTGAPDTDQPGQCFNYLSGKTVQRLRTTSVGSQLVASRQMLMHKRLGVAMVTFLASELWLGNLSRKCHELGLAFFDQQFKQTET
jgi:hypothetical protein